MAVPSDTKPLKASSKSLKEKPGKCNILYLMTDQQFAGAISCAGNRYLNTPAIDSIAKEGVIFDKAYCSQPLCVPSRASISTGKMPHQIDVIINQHPRADHLSDPMIGKVLSDGGYDCAHIGKWHQAVPVKQKQLHGFATVLHPGPNKIDKLIPETCAEFIKAEREKPFFLLASFVNPHDICQWARNETLPNGSIAEAPPADQCPALPGNFEIPAGEPEILREIQKLSPRAYPTTQWKKERWKQYRWAYYRLIEKVDAQIGMILKALQKSGKAENTVIIFTSDHGDGTGAHRWNQKQILYDQATRVPFIVSLPGVTKAGYIDRDHLVATGLDSFATICDYAGIEPPAELTGRSVRKLAEGKKVKNWRDLLVCETTFCEFGESYGVTGRMLRSKRYKYIVYSDGPGIWQQLFDMQQDPGETNDIAGKTEYRQILKNHQKHLADWCRQTDDFFAVPAVREKA